ncbi:MAG: site-specific integrase [Acidobacteriota bacterium]
MTLPHPADADNPAAVYRDSLSRGSYWAVHHSLQTVAGLLGSEDPWSYPWHELRYRDTARIRARLVESYAPATVNKVLSALRGVLKTCWRLGLVDSETYARAADVSNVRARVLPAGQGLGCEQVEKLLATCVADPSPAGRRDAAIFAVLYGGGLRRAELCGLDLEDFGKDGCRLTIRSGKGRQDRRIFLHEDSCQLIRTWIATRGESGGPLFCPVSAAGTLRLTRLRGEAVRFILQKRQRQAGLDGLTPHDFRRAFVSRLLDAGVDVFTVQKLAGHADAKTTARYDRRGDAARRAAAASLTLY